MTYTSKKIEEFSAVINHIEKLQTTYGNHGIFFLCRILVDDEGDFTVQGEAYEKPEETVKNN